MLRTLFDLVEALLLFAAAGLSLKAWRRLAIANDPGQRFWFIAGIGTTYLGLDEFFSLHERIGRVLYYDLHVPDPPGVNHMDDAVLMVIALAGVAVMLAWWREIVREPLVLRLFIVGGACLAGAMVIDSVGHSSRTFDWWLEEVLEASGAGLFAVAFERRSRLAAAPGRLPLRQRQRIGEASAQ